MPYSSEPSLPAPDEDSGVRELLDRLRASGFLDDSPVRCEPLTGGVSSDIHLLSQGKDQWVVKRALARLRVKADWTASLSRNHYEQAYLKEVGRLVPDAVPRILHSDPEAGFFVMEYLGQDLANWKQLLLQGRATAGQAGRAGHLLGRIHAGTMDNARLAGIFDSRENFHQLRLDPYFLSLREIHPDLTARIEEMVEVLSQSRRCLVHGDFSPKNILLNESRLVVLDCEVAWYGEPTFDVAFLIHHLLLKSIYRKEDGPVHDQMIHCFIENYERETGRAWAEVRKPLPVLTALLLLARIDGKSPVEYLSETDRDRVRKWALYFLRDGGEDWDGFLSGFSRARNHSGEIARPFR